MAFSKVLQEYNLGAEDRKARHYLDVLIPTVAQRHKPFSVQTLRRFFQQLDAALVNFDQVVIGRNGIGYAPLVIRLRQRERVRSNVLPTNMGNVGSGRDSVNVSRKMRMR